MVGLSLTSIASQLLDFECCHRGPSLSKESYRSANIDGYTQKSNENFCTSC